jgi:MurNAc alpha-1-phosphate uridylyltransferase
MLPLAILAGGFATRLGSLTRDIPKCLIEIKGRPFVEWQLDLLIKNGYSDFVFCISYKSQMIQDYLDDGSSKGIRIQYSTDGDKQLGTGGAISNAMPLLGDKFGVLYGDSYLPINYGEVEDFFTNSNFLGAMTVYKNDGLFDSSNVEYSEGLLKDYNKENKNPRMRHIDYGLSYFNSEAFETCPRGEFFDLSNLFSDLVRQKKIGGHEVNERFYEIGSVQGIEDFSSYLERHRDEF